jgi:hypothetical protein
VQFLLESGADQSLTARAVDHPLSPGVVGSSGVPSGIGLNGPMFALTRPESAGSIGSSKSSTLSLAEDQQTPIIWAYERGHDQIVALLKQYANRRPDSDVCSEYRSGSPSFINTPSLLFLSLSPDLKSSVYRPYFNRRVVYVRCHSHFSIILTRMKTCSTSHLFR